MLKIALRGIHVLAAGILAGSYVLESSPGLQARWLAAAVLSGLLLLLLDVHESCVFLLQIRGYFVIFKLAALGFLYRLEPVPASWLLVVLLVVSVVSSHAPSAIRYAAPLGSRRFRGARTKG
jgi:hypothetical protein